MLSVGQQAYIELGAYGLVMLCDKVGLDPFMAVPLAVVAAGVISYLAFRLSGDGSASDVPREQTGVDVVDEAADRDGVGHQRVGADAADVLGERRELVVDDVELLPAGVRAGRGGDPVLELALGMGGHRAARVRDDEDASYAEQVHAEDQRFERLRGDAPAGVAEDLGVAVLQAEHGERVDPRVHAGDHRDPGVCHAVEATELEVRGKGAVGVHEIVEIAHAATLADGHDRRVLTWE